MKKFIISSIFLFFSTNVFASDNFFRFFAYGEATGTYEENRFDIKENINSTSYVYGNLSFPKKDLLSSTVVPCT